MANAYEAQVPIQLGDQELLLQIDFRAVASYMTHLDTNDWPAAIGEAFDKYDMEKVCRILKIALERNHPEITIEDIMDASPPFQVTLQLIQTSLLLFLYGHPRGLENLDLNERKDQEAAESKSPLSNGRARWRALGPQRLRSALGMSSGS